MSAHEDPTAWADGIIGHYERHARDWDADRRANPWNEKPWHDRFIEMLPRDATVLDLGCGGGSPVALNLVQRGLQVTGVDASATLISLCRDRMPDHEWLVADMRSLALGRKFAGVLAWDSFFHLKPDAQRRMFGVFAAHAAASASLMFNTGPAAGVAIGRYRGDPLYHASLDATEYAALLGKSGFDVVAHVVEDRHAAAGRTVWLARYRDFPASRSAVDELYSELGREPSDPATPVRRACCRRPVSPGSNRGRRLPGTER